MSISISYSTTYSGWTVADYLADWSAYFGDVNHRPGQVVDGSNTGGFNPGPVSYTHLRAHETGRNLVCRLLLEKKKKKRHDHVCPA